MPAQRAEMYRRVLAGYEKEMGQNHKSVIDIIHKLGILYSDRSSWVRQGICPYRRRLEEILLSLFDSYINTVAISLFFYIVQQSW